MSGLLYKAVLFMVEAVLFRDFWVVGRYISPRDWPGTAVLNPVAPGLLYQRQTPGNTTAAAGGLVFLTLTSASTGQETPHQGISQKHQIYKSSAMKRQPITTLFPFVPRPVRHPVKPG